MFFVGLILLVLSGCSDKKIDSRPTVQPTEGISITLTPNASAYDLMKVPQGVVRFSATINNDSRATIIIAHPSICFPVDVKAGEGLHIKDRHGKSELLLEITKPNATKVILRDGSHGFDPNLVYLFTIPPGGKESFSLGWFFQNARGRWENDTEAWMVFLEKGTYKIRIIFRNVFPKAAVYNTAANKPESVSVWTGKMLSSEIAVEIK
jgi:hypothetical protein